MDKIPMELRNFINTKLKPNFDSYMRHTLHDFLPTTNNALENYFGVTLPRHLKKIYKTTEGITMYLDLQMEMGQKLWKNLAAPWNIGHSHLF